MMISMPVRIEMSVWRRSLFWPVSFAHKIFVSPDSGSFQFFHDVSFPILIKHPGINRYYIQSHFRIDGFFCFDSWGIVLISDQTVILDIDIVLGQMKVRIPDSRFFLGRLDQYAGFIVILDCIAIQEICYSTLPSDLKIGFFFPSITSSRFWFTGLQRYLKMKKYLKLSHYFKRTNKIFISVDCFGA